MTLNTIDKIIILIIAFTLIVTVGYYKLNVIESSKLNDKQIEQDNTIKEKKKLQVVINNDSDAVIEYTDVDNILSYNKTNLQYALENGRVILFFTSKNCTSCASLVDELKNNKNKLPSDLIFLVVDINNSIQIVNKYNIKIPYTFVQIDENLDEINKWINGDLNNILNKIK